MSSDFSFPVSLKFRQKVIEGESTKQIYDIVRKSWITAQPEEIVRQEILHKMIYELGYPQSLIIIERPLSLIPHLVLQQSKILPQRRVDILCFAQNDHLQFSLHPLLMIECKALIINQKTWRQVIGYNEYVKAQFLAISNGRRIQVGWYDNMIQDYQFIDFLPSYRNLLQAM